MTQLLVACVAVFACTLASVTVVREHRGWHVLSESDADRARSHADYVYLHDQLTKCGEQLANAGAEANKRAHDDYVYLHDQLTSCGEKLAACEGKN